MSSKKIAITLEVANEAQARELDAAWKEIVTGRTLARTEALEHGTEDVMERARPAIQAIEAVIRQHPTTGQAGRLVRFLAAIYNGYEYSFDLTELRSLDTRLANACLDYINYDRLGKQEVHHHLSGGDRELQRWIEEYRVPPRIQLNTQDEQLPRLLSLVKRYGYHPNDLAREAFDMLLQRYEGSEFGSLVSERAEQQNHRGAGEPLVRHARRLHDQNEAPLCGAPGAPWRAGPFVFDTLTCEACRDIVLVYDAR